MQIDYSSVDIINTRNADGGGVDTSKSEIAKHNKLMFKRYADFMNTFGIEGPFFSGGSRTNGSILTKWLSFNFLPATRVFQKTAKIHPASQPDYSLSLGEVQIFESPVTIVCSKIGASVGVFIWDTCTAVSGAAYILWSGRGEYGVGEDSCVELILKKLFDTLIEKGSTLKNLHVKIVGGSDMFAFGRKNVDSVLQVLHQYQVKIDAIDVGGKYCRMARFNSSNNLLLVKTSESSYFKIY